MHQYRPEIDGLRALAVIPVTLFHAGLPVLPGGFVGVDVFFVISGYLITSLILAENAAGTFSLASFYERRVRRILPALLTVAAVCIPFAYFWMLPGELASFGKSLVATTLFASNFHFASETGYFAVSGEFKPLLHTWSLAVEEQFYVVFPLLVLLLLRLPRVVVPTVLVVLALASVSIAHFGLLHTTEARFFLPTGRVWELLVGALVAIHLAHRPLNSSASLREAASIVGLLMILAAMTLFGKTTPSPSAFLLLPVAGTALLIAYCSPDTLVGRVLSQRQVVGVGLISYSLYLWHQPALAFMRLRSPGEPSLALTCGVLAGCVVAAYLTWRFIETPARNRKRFARIGVFGSALLVSAAVASVGVWLAKSEGFPKRTLGDGSTLSDLDQRVRVNHGLHGDCEGQFTLSSNCRTSDTPELMVWGDSYAMHLVPALLASKPDLKMIQMTKSVCGPTLGLSPLGLSWDRKWADGCLEFNQKVWDWLATNQSVKHVVLAAVFTQYTTEGFSFLTEKGDVVPMTSPTALSYFRSTVAALRARGITVSVITPPPRDGRNIGRCLVRSKAIGFDSADCAVSRANAERHQKAVRAIIAELKTFVRVIDLPDLMCNGDRCDAYRDGAFLYRDDGHLSYEGGKLLGPMLGEVGLYELVVKP